MRLALERCALILIVHHLFAFVILIVGSWLVFTTSSVRLFFHDPMITRRDRRDFHFLNSSVLLRSHCWVYVYVRIIICYYFYIILLYWSLFFKKKCTINMSIAYKINKIRVPCVITIIVCQDFKRWWRWQRWWYRHKASLVTVSTYLNV